MGWRLRRKIYNLWSGESNTDGKTLGKNLKYCDRRRYQRRRVEKNTSPSLPSRNFTKKAPPQITHTVVHIDLGQEDVSRF